MSIELINKMLSVVFIVNILHTCSTCRLQQKDDLRPYTAHVRAPTRKPYLVVGLEAAYACVTEIRIA